MSKLTSTYAYIEALSLGGPPPSQLPALEKAFEAAVEAAGARCLGSGSRSKAASVDDGGRPVSTELLEPDDGKRREARRLTTEVPVPEAVGATTTTSSEARRPKARRPPVGGVPRGGGSAASVPSDPAKLKRHRKAPAAGDPVPVAFDGFPPPGAPSVDAAVALLMIGDGDAEEALGAPKAASTANKRRQGAGRSTREAHCEDRVAALAAPPPPAARPRAAAAAKTIKDTPATSPPDVDLPEGGSGGGRSVERRIPGRLLPWPCPRCTLHNSGTAKKCGACKLRREAVSSGTWRQAPVPQIPLPGQQQQQQAPGNADLPVDPPAGTGTVQRRSTGAASTATPAPTATAVKSAGPVKRRLSSMLSPAKAVPAAAAAVDGSVGRTHGTPREHGVVGAGAVASDASAAVLPSPAGGATVSKRPKVKSAPLTLGAISSLAPRWGSAAVSSSWLLLGSGLDEADKVTSESAWIVPPKSYRTPKQHLSPSPDQGVSMFSPSFRLVRRLLDPTVSLLAPTPGRAQASRPAFGSEGGAGQGRQVALDGQQQGHARRLQDGAGAPSGPPHDQVPHGHSTCEQHPWSGRRSIDCLAHDKPMNGTYECHNIIEPVLLELFFLEVLV